MAGAGYGNHQDGERSDEGRGAPRETEQKPEPKREDRRETLTPGEGAGPAGAQGDEVDPGVG